MNLFYQPNLKDGHFYLDSEESRHAIKVLRKNVGDQIKLIDGFGTFYDGTITKADSSKCEFLVTSTTPEASKKHFIHIAISPTKNSDRIEWFVEKAVEFGIDKITLMSCQKSERSHLKTDRLERVAISAMKQSLKATLPTIEAVTKFNDVIKSSSEINKFIAYVDTTNPNHLKDLAKVDSSVIVLIGPEGDFSETELSLALKHDFKKVSLGQSRLRTETAGLAACHIINLINS